MSMLNRRLQTQPLDPAVLQAIEKRSVSALPPLSPSRETAPLTSLDGILADRLVKPAAPAAGVPAQAPSVSSALQPSLNSSLNENEAQLLLGVSSRLASVRQQDPAQFHQVLQGFKQLNADSQGQVDFSNLNDVQRQALTGLGLTPQNTKVIFQQLYQLLSPNAPSQANGDAFKQVQASVTGFISNLDLRTRAFNQISEQARDLSAVQGVVSHLSAGSIQSLLADQTASVFDLSVSQINKSNFDIRNAMDYTLGHFVVLSQQSPTTLQQVEGALQKLKQDGVLDSGERSLLNRFGLSVNSENKLQTLDGNVLDFASVNKLENVIFSMKDPTEGYQRVLAASAAVIQQSGKLEALSAQAQQQAQTVQVTATAVQQKNVELRQIHADADRVNTQLRFAQTKADHITDVMESATGLFGDLQVAPALLERWQIKVLPQPNGTHQFFIADKQVSRLELIQHLGKLLRAQQAEIEQMAAQLAQKKGQAVQVIAQITEGTEVLAAQTDDLAHTQQQIKQEEGVLRQMVVDRDRLIADVAPSLKPEEKQILETQLTPAVDRHVQQAQKQVQDTLKVVEQVIVRSREVQAESHDLVAVVQADFSIWDQSLRMASLAAAELGNWAARLTQEEQKITATESSSVEIISGHGPIKSESSPDLNQTPLTSSKAAPAEADALTIRAAQQRQQAHQEVQRRNESIFLEQTQREKRRGEAQAAVEQERLDAMADKQRLQQEVQALRQE